MTATIVTPDVLDGYEFEVPCEAGQAVRSDFGCKGQRPAEWILWLARCHEEVPPVVLWCTACRDALLNYPYGVHCRACGADFTPGSKAIIRMEPLRRPA